MIFLPICAGLLIGLGKSSWKWLSFVGDVTRVLIFIQSCLNLWHVWVANDDIAYRFADEGILGIGMVSDHVSSVFVVTAAFIFLLVGLYMRTDRRLDSTFHLLLLVIEGVVIAAFLSIDLFNIFVLLELATIICGIIMMTLRDKRSVYDGLIYIMINTVGIMFYLLGVGFIYQIFGNLDLPTIQAQVSHIPAKDLMLPAAFVFTGLSVKAALFPVGFWLPQAHGSPGSPSVVSAVLSGIYIKITLFAFIRLIDVFRDVFPIAHVILFIALITSLMGIFLALSTQDIKMLLAYSTMSQIGVIMIGIASSHPISYYGGLFHIVNHALFKSQLFMTTGLIVSVYQSRQMTKIDGVWKRSPILGLALLLGFLGITGAPFFNGAVSKYYVGQGYTSGWMKYAFEVINFGTIFYFVKLAAILKTHQGAPSSMQSQRKLAVSETTSVLLAGLAIILTGIFGSQIFKGMSGIDSPLSLATMLHKGVYWCIYVGVAILIHKWLWPKISRYRYRINAAFSFQTMVFMVVLLFSLYLGVFWWSVKA